MLNTLWGTIEPEDSGPGYITLNVAGVGYQVFVVGRTQMEPQHSRCFYIHENIVAAQRGPSKHDLYGFETKEERELFRALLKCDDVGPVTAMKAMNIAPPAQLLQAIRLDGSEAYLKRGVGEQTARNIILGLAKYAASAGAKRNSFRTCGWPMRRSPGNPSSTSVASVSRR